MKSSQGWTGRGSFLRSFIKTAGSWVWWDTVTRKYKVDILLPCTLWDNAKYFSSDRLQINWGKNQTQIFKNRNQKHWMKGNLKWIEYHRDFAPSVWGDNVDSSYNWEGATPWFWKPSLGDFANKVRSSILSQWQKYRLAWQFGVWKCPKENLIGWHSISMYPALDLPKNKAPVDENLSNRKFKGSKTI